MGYVLMTGDDVLFDKVVVPLMGKNILLASEKQKTYQKAYRQSDKGKAYHKRYQKAYRQSDKYKTYRKSDKYKTYQKRYHKSDKYKTYQKNYYLKQKKEKAKQ